MKGLKVKDLRANEPDELRRTLRKLEEELFKFKMKQSTNQLENTMLIRHARRDIARIHTVLTERSAAAPATAKPATQEAIKE